MPFCLLAADLPTCALPFPNPSGWVIDLLNARHVIAKSELGDFVRIKAG